MTDNSQKDLATKNSNIIFSRYEEKQFHGKVEENCKLYVIKERKLKILTTAFFILFFYTRKSRCISCKSNGSAQGNWDWDGNTILQVKIIELFTVLEVG